jgi:hypothetical protein
MTPISDDEAEKYLVTLTEGLQSVGALTEKVKELDKHVTISEETAEAAQTAALNATDAVEQVSWVTKLAIGCSILALVAAGLSFWSLRQNCLSANSTREASIEIWDVVVEASARPNMSAAEKERSEQFSAYVAEVNKPHDCWNLLKEYSTPPRPHLASSG